MSGLDLRGIGPEGLRIILQGGLSVKEMAQRKASDAAKMYQEGVQQQNVLSHHGVQEKLAESRLNLDAYRAQLQEEVNQGRLDATEAGNRLREKQIDIQMRNSDIQARNSNIQSRRLDMMNQEKPLTADQRVDLDKRLADTYFAITAGKDSKGNIIDQESMRGQIEFWNKYNPTKPFTYQQGVPDKAFDWKDSLKTLPNLLDSGEPAKWVPPAPGVSGKVEGGGLPTPQTEEEFNSLPKGSKYIDPDDGQTYIK